MSDNLIVGLKLKPRRKKNRKAFWLLLLIFIGAINLYIYISQSRIELVSPLSKIKVSSSLRSVVNDSLNGAKGTYGVVIKNLKTDETYYINEHKIFETGSLYKLWVMASVYEQIQDGKLTEDEVISDDVAVINREFNISPDWAELSEGTVTFSVRDALSQMITISHNYAALLLTKKIKLSAVAVFLKEKGFIESSVGTSGDSPMSTASDIALFYERLYKGELADQQYTNKMIDLLKGQQLNGGLPKYLTDKPMVAHKTGEINWLKHDAGIIYTDKGDYIIVVLSESNSPVGAQERIALLSKAVYDYFVSN